MVSDLWLFLHLHEVSDTGDLPSLGPGLVGGYGEGEDYGGVGRPGLCRGQHNLAPRLRSASYCITVSRDWHDIRTRGFEKLGCRLKVSTF